MQLEVRWLKDAFAWATDRVRPSLLAKSPIAGATVDVESIPRPKMTTEYLNALLLVADEVHPYLWTALTIAADYGRRRTPLFQLRVDDVDLDRGTIRWRSENVDPIALLPLSRRAILKWLAERGVESPWLFPAPTDPDRPVDPEMMGKRATGRDPEGPGTVRPPRGPTARISRPPRRGRDGAARRRCDDPGPDGRVTLEVRADADALRAIRPGTG